MTLVEPVAAALAGLVLFLVPGLVFLALARRDPRGPALRSDEAAFLAVGISVMVSAWLALVLAEAGRFSLVGAAGIELMGGLVAIVLGRRRLAPPIPPMEGFRAVAPALIVLAVALGLHARPSEYVFGGRDPGAYVSAMALIARTDGLMVTDQVVQSIPPEAVPLFFRDPENPARFMGFPLEIETGRVYPEFFHLFPAFGAYLFQSMGTRGALATPPVFGVLGTLAVFFSLRRIVSDGAAFVAAFLLAINVLQVWFARYPMSEPMSQFLIFAGLLALHCWEDEGSPAFGALAGAAFGLSLLVRIDSVLIAAPLAAYLAVRRARRDLTWRQAAPLLAAFAAFAIHGAMHAWFWAHKYVDSILRRDYWRQPAWVWVSAAVAVPLLLVLADRLGPTLARRVAPASRYCAIAASVLLITATAYGYVLRPRLSAWAGADGNEVPGGVELFRRLDVNGDDGLSPQEIAAGPLTPRTIAAMDYNRDGRLSRSDWKSGPPRWPWLRAFRHLAAHDAQTLVRFGWFVSPLGIVLGVGGLALAFCQWRARYFFLVLLTLAFGGFYLYKMRVTHDYFFAARRFVPVILPAVLAWAAFLLLSLARRGPSQRGLAAVAGLGLAGLYAAGTRPILTWREWKGPERQGAVAIVNDLARRFGPQDVVVFEQPGSLHWLSLPLWAHHGVNVLELARYNPDPDTLGRLVETWRQRYRNIYFVSTYRSDPYLCSLFLQQVEAPRAGVWEWERAYDRPPTRPVWHSLEYRISRVVPPGDLQVPPLPEVDIGGSDDLQVSGFFLKEGGGAETFRWTGPCASIYLPGAKPGHEVVIRASAGRRPVGDWPSAIHSGGLVRVGPAAVRLSLSGTPLGEFVAGADWAEYRFRLPPVRPSAPVLRLDVRAWRPMNVFAGSPDSRDLGVMIDRVRVEPVG